MHRRARLGVIEGGWGRMWGRALDSHRTRSIDVDHPCVSSLHPAQTKPVNKAQLVEVLHYYCNGEGNLAAPLRHGGR
jgi:hypothetical protein